MRKAAILFLFLIMKDLREKCKSFFVGKNFGWRGRRKASFFYANREGEKKMGKRYNKENADEEI